MADGALAEAIAEFKAGRMKAALALLEKAAKLEPERAEVWNWVGRVYAAEGQWERSVLCCQRACELNPKEEDACYYLGRNLYTLNRFEGALAALGEALEVDPEAKRWRVYRAVAQAQEALGTPEEAEGSSGKRSRGSAARRAWMRIRGSTTASSCTARGGPRRR